VKFQKILSLIQLNLKIQAHFGNFPVDFIGKMGVLCHELLGENPDFLKFHDQFHHHLNTLCLVEMRGQIQEKGDKSAT